MSKPATVQAFAAPGSNTQMFVTMRLDKQLFGISVKYVRDVLRDQKITSIALAPPEVAGSLNLRGRIVTVIDVRQRLGLSGSNDYTKATFVVVEVKNELYSLMVDNVGEVLTVANESIEKAPANLGGRWRDIASGIYKLENELLVLIDVQTLLNV